MSWKEHLPFSKSPFGPGEDPAELMISQIAREANAAGQPLTEEQRKRLLEEVAVASSEPDEFQHNVRRLIESIIKREREAAGPWNPGSFLGTIEWAGDGRYPLVVQIAESVVSETPWPLPRWYNAKDILLCIGCAFVVIVVTAIVIVGVHSLLGFMK